jgi:hypothetical protein
MDSLAELAAEGLGLVGLTDELVPLVWIARQNALVGEEDGDVGGMELVLDDIEGLPKVPVRDDLSSLDVPAVGPQ